MLTKPKTIVYPGGSGQAACCQYQIALSHDWVRPKVAILLWHEDDYKGSIVTHTGFSCDNAVNKIINTDLHGISIYDVKIYYQCNLGFEDRPLNIIPYKLKWEQKLSCWEKIKQKLGYKKEFYPSPNQEKCGNVVLETEPNTSISIEESEKVSTLFQLNRKKESIPQEFHISKNKSEQA